MPARRRRRRRQQQQREFHLFGKLPTELRLKIWVYTWKPRTVSLYPIDDDHFLRPGGKNPLPASGYVNFESRSETLRHYKRCFAHPDKTDFRWFNFRLDTLCLAASWWFLDKLDPRDLRQVQRLIVPEPLSSAISAATPCRDKWPEPVTESFESPMVKELLEENYPSLREITLTTNMWMVREQYSPRDKLEDCYIFQAHPSLYKGWGHMRTTYIEGFSTGPDDTQV
ncbi:hypothetical protein HD806DRAFT_546837 [Xylariaceae sp. AK1471]|nr:hypothetical protein HD806DRAFT_546837 [Xylariaceae sp. AK1471]